MAFFQRILGYLVNEVLVSGLANSKTFQRFAVRSNDMIQEMSKKGVEHRSKYAEQLENFGKTFREEMKKGMDEQFGRGQGGRR